MRPNPHTRPWLASGAFLVLALMACDGADDAAESLDMESEAVPAIEDVEAPANTDTTADARVAKGCCTLVREGQDPQDLPGMTRGDCDDLAEEQPDVIDHDWREGSC